MITDSRKARRPGLERFNDDDSSATEFTMPIKRINDGDDLTFFLTSTTYRDLMTWLLQLNRSMFPTKNVATGARPAENRLDTPPQYSENVRNLRRLLDDLTELVQKAPPDTGPRRFGNVAFRTWFKLAEEVAKDLLDSHLNTVLRKYGELGDQRRIDARDELCVYLLGGFGSAQRLDYGTGHELSFLAFLAGLWKLGAFEPGEEKSIVIGLVEPYLDLIRKLVLTYTLEPAGSHGVWGLDDHSFVPYIFGSAQLGPTIEPDDYSRPTPTEGSLDTAPPPSAVTNKILVGDYKDANMYFSAIQFIYDVKRGPFWEHSPVLYDISGIKDGWGKINKGMLKMYAAEVLGKFPVVQHFPFGSLFAWKADPEATNIQASVHAQQQPNCMDVPPPPLPVSASAGTRAPWARLATGATADVFSGATMKPPIPGAGTAPTAAPWAAKRGAPR